MNNKWVHKQNGYTGPKSNADDSQEQMFGERVQK